MSDPEQAGPRKAPSYPDHGAGAGAGSSTAVLALCLSGRGRYLGNLRHLSGKQDARLLRSGRAEPAGAFAGDELSPGRRPPRRDSEGAGSTPPSDGAATPVLAAASEAGLTRARMLPPPGALGGAGRGGGQGRSQAGAGLASTTSFVPGDVPKLCCPARKPPAFESVWLLRLKQIKRKHS